MTSLMCPKCRQAVSDAALDAGQCPSCGYDGPMVSLVAGAKRAWLVVTLAVITGGVALGGHLLIRQPTPRLATPDTAVVIPPPVSQAHAPQNRGEPIAMQTAPAPRPVVPAQSPMMEPIAVAPIPVAVVSPKKQPPIGPVVRINAKEVRQQQLDNPVGIAAVADMNGEDRVTLTGKVRLLKIGSVGGKATLDASGLEAEEIVITGDLSKSAVVKLHAPNGKVTLGGHIVGSAKLAVNAPGGEVVVSTGSAKLDNAAEVTVTANRVEVNGLMTGEAKLVVTLTTGGSLKLGVMDGGATVIYKRATPTDPEPKFEPGVLRGGAKVHVGT